MPVETVIPLRSRSEARDALARPLRDVRISVMDRCNFRCPYCMPASTFHDGYRFLSSRDRLSFSEITRLAQVFVQLGTRKLRITGGEPLLRTGLPDLISDLSIIQGVEDVALTTNGVLLARHAAELKAAGLGRITVSLDSVDAAIFKQLAGGNGSLSEVLEGIDAALRAGLAPVKVNCVIQRGVNEMGALDIVERFRNTGVVVRFIEYMDVGNRNAWRPELVLPSRELMQRIDARWPLRSLDRQYRGEVATRYAFEDGAGEVGFISSISQPFCGDCSRARLSSDGVLYTCLFATEGVPLREPLREGASDEELVALVRSAWEARTDRYSEQRATLRARSGAQSKVEMFYIGG